MPTKILFDRLSCNCAVACMAVSNGSIVAVGHLSHFFATSFNRPLSLTSAAGGGKRSAAAAAEVVGLSADPHGNHGDNQTQTTGRGVS